MLECVHDIYQLSFGFAKVLCLFGFHGLLLVDLVCASASVGHVRRDLELMDAVQHCFTLVALRCVELIFLCWLSSLLQALLTFAVLGFRLHLHCLLDRGGKDDLCDLVLMAFDAPGSGCSVDSSDNSLIEEYLAHRRSFPASCAQSWIASFLVQAVTV